MIKSHGYAAQTATSPLAPFSFQRREPNDHDVLIDIDYCGVCHSDIHQARNGWGGSVFPIVPGHEIVGHITQVGKAVSRFKVGDRVGVGCIVNSCRTCHPCEMHLEQYCLGGCTWTYNSPELGGVTYGGYSNNIVVNEDFVLRVPTDLAFDAVAPLLCAGITTYSPLKHWQVKQGQKVGIVGLGGLGHMGVKFAHAMGAETWVVTQSPNKKADALRLGAKDIVISKNPDDLARHTNSFDLLLCTVSAPYDINEYLSLLKLDGTLVIVGLPENPLELAPFSLISQRRRIVGSLIGGIAETQEMLDFCGKHHITSDIELIRMDQINHAYERMLRSDVRYRFVIDMKSLG